MWKNKTEGVLNSIDLRKPHNKLIYFCMWFFLVFLSLVCLLPTIWVVLSGFKETAEMYSVPPTLFPSHIDLGKFVDIWTTVDFGNAFINSLLLIVGCWTFDICFNGLAGYVLSRVRPKGSALIETAIFWTMLMPGASMVPLYMTFADVPFLHINLLGSRLPIWLMAGCSAFSVLLFRNFFNGIPKEYFEAARVDGCSNIGCFFRIILPLSKPIIAVESVFVVTGTWGNFMWPYLILGNTDKEPISVLLYQISQSAVMQDNQFMLLMLLSIIPPLIIYALLSKQIMGGFNMSGVKG